MDSNCPGCGYPLASPDDICPRCALVKAVPPIVSRMPGGTETSRLWERRMMVGPDRNVRRSLHTILLIAVGLTLLLCVVIALLVWALFGI